MGKTPEVRSVHHDGSPSATVLEFALHWGGSLTKTCPCVVDASRRDCKSSAPPRIVPQDMAVIPLPREIVFTEDLRST
jgi:hypothetical protein